eukprot:2045245-Rhodomonas_salina.1
MTFLTAFLYRVSRVHPCVCDVPSSLLFFLYLESVAGTAVGTSGTNITAGSPFHPPLLSSLVESCEKDCTQFPTLIATAHILLGMAYKRLGDGCTSPLF